MSGNTAPSGLNLEIVSAGDRPLLDKLRMTTNQTNAGITRSGVSASYTDHMINPSGPLSHAGSSPGNSPIASIEWFAAARPGRRKGNQINHDNGKLAASQQPLLAPQDTQNNLPHAGAFVASASYSWVFGQGGSVDKWPNTPSYSYNASDIRLAGPATGSERASNAVAAQASNSAPAKPLPTSASQNTPYIDRPSIPGSISPYGVNLEMVTVGDPGNQRDPRTGFGSVGYNYKISKYEVTIEQYTRFLNAVAASDPYQLYNPNMAADQTIAGIARSGVSGSYTYSVISPSGPAIDGASSPGNRPIAYIDWFDAARFANWMNNGQGSADTETGAYALRGAIAGSTVSANPNARFTIPTQDEWYKAAYYSPILNNGKGGYYVFPTQSNATPGSIPNNVVANRGAANQVNYYNGRFSVTQQPLLSPQNNQNYLTNVGAFVASSSYYGTFDQGGNVYEWIDTPGNSTQGRLRGGFWMSNMADLSYLDYYNTAPSYSFNGSGFRLASPVTGSAREPEVVAAQPSNSAALKPVTTSANQNTASQNTIYIGGMAMVAVSQAGNKADERTGNGSAGYAYNIGKYEVTIQQYVDFLNAVAARDPYQLYNPNMATDLTIAGIARVGNPGSYTYHVIAPAGATPAGASSPGNRPIAYVSWFDAARFANWMHNGRGAADTETGAYTLNGAITGKAVAVNPGARFHIPTTNEWYKAAYYSPNLNGGQGGYYDFASQTNATLGSVPGNDINKRGTPTQANYFNGGFAVTQAVAPSTSQNYLTDVGAFTASASFYGTFDQGGNVYEWIDSQGSLSERSVRGGYWVSNVADTSYLDDYILPPDFESRGSGFRLASLQNNKQNQAGASSTSDALVGWPVTSNISSSTNGDSLTQFSSSDPGQLSGATLPSTRLLERTASAASLPPAPSAGDWMVSIVHQSANAGPFGVLAADRPFTSLPSGM